MQREKYLINNRFFRCLLELWRDACIKHFRLARNQERKIEIMSKLLWITTLPNTQTLAEMKGENNAREKANSEIADANYLIF